MRMILKRLPSHLLENKAILDLGCGRHKIKSALGIDIMAVPGVDVVADLEKALPFDDASFDVVHADQVLEHVKDLVSLVYEVHRILRPGGHFVIKVPYFRSSWAHIDPTHVRSFTIASMDYFVTGTWCYEGYRFRNDAFRSVEVFLDPAYKSTFIRGLLSTLALKYPARFENSCLSSMFPFQQIAFVLTK